MRPQCPKCGRRVTKGGQALGVQRYRCTDLKACSWNGTRPAHESRAIRSVAAHDMRAKLRRAKCFVITAAQNATPVHPPFLAALRHLCATRGAELLVIPYRYKNPTSMWSDKAKDDDWWASEVVPHLSDTRADLNPHLVLLGDVRTQPTASSPLQGLETILGSKSGIVGHPKLELLCVPTPAKKLPKILTTTGAVTIANYIPSKAGTKGEHHHTFGACIVEIDGDVFHLRQINAVHDGSFHDLGERFTHRGVTKVAPSALVMGDSHLEFIDPSVADATFGPGGIIPTLGIKTAVWHDVHDFYSRNHHHRGEVFVNFVKHHTGRDNVEKALDECFAFLDRVTAKGQTNVFVSSNHPDALARWVKETDPRSDPTNAVFWARTFEAMCLGSAWTDTGARTIDPFRYWAERKLRKAAQARFMARDESYTIHGIEVGYHGDRGPNGSRGNIRGFGRIGAKTVIGHSHTPGVKDGVYQVGTSSRLGLEYTSGPSSWLHTHCLIYPNGKRSLVSVVNGRWRGTSAQVSIR